MRKISKLYKCVSFPAAFENLPLYESKKALKKKKKKKRKKKEKRKENGSRKREKREKRGKKGNEKRKKDRKRKKQRKIVFFMIERRDLLIRTVSLYSIISLYFTLSYIT